MTASYKSTYIKAWNFNVVDPLKLVLMWLYAIIIIRESLTLTIWWLLQTIALWNANLTEKKRNGAEFQMPNCWLVLQTWEVFHLYSLCSWNRSFLQQLKRCFSECIRFMGTGYFVTYFYTFEIYNLSKTKSSNGAIPIISCDFYCWLREYMN